MVPTSGVDPWALLKVPLPTPMVRRMVRVELLAAARSKYLSPFEIGQQQIGRRVQARRSPPRFRNGAVADAEPGRGSIACAIGGREVELAVVIDVAKDDGRRPRTRSVVVVVSQS